MRSSLPSYFNVGPRLLASPSSAKNAGQNREVVPRIEHRLIASEAATVIANDPAGLAQLDPIGIGPDFHGSADRAPTPSICSCQTEPGRSSRPPQAPRGKPSKRRHSGQGWDALP